MRPLALACFGYVLLRPVPSNRLLLAALAFMWLAAVAAIIGRRRSLAPVCGVVLLVQLGYGAYGVLRSLPADCPGLPNAVGVTLLLPLLFWTLVWAADVDTVRLALRCLAWATVLVSTAVVLYVANRRGVLPPLVPGRVLIGSGSGFNDFGDYTEVRFYGLSTLAAAGPLWTASLLVRGTGLPSLPLRCGAAGSALLATLVGGRRAIVLLVLLAPPLLWLCRRVIGARPTGRLPRGAVLAAAVGVVGGAYAATRLLGGFDVAAPVRNALGGALALLSGTADPGTGLLAEESHRLLAEWSVSPVVGHGMGATITGYSRSVQRPWNFELQYHLLLFQTGLLGAAAFGAVLLLAVRALRRAAAAAPDRAPALLVCSVGAGAMLLANASNPYLQAPGHMWAVYLPLALANAVLTGGAARTGSRSTAEASTHCPRTAPASSGSG